MATRSTLLGRNRRFRRLWLARVVSFLGDSMGLVALILYVAEEVGSGTVVALLLLAGDFTPMLLSPFVGAIADRLDRRRLLVTCEALGPLLAAALLPFMSPLGLLSIDALTFLASPLLLAGVSRMRRQPRRLRDRRSCGPVRGPLHLAPPDPPARRRRLPGGGRVQRGRRRSARVPGTGDLRGRQLGGQPAVRRLRRRSAPRVRAARLTGRSIPSRHHRGRRVRHRQRGQSAHRPVSGHRGRLRHATGAWRRHQPNGGRTHHAAAAHRAARIPSVAPSRISTARSAWRPGVRFSSAGRSWTGSRPARSS